MKDKLKKSKSNTKRSSKKPISSKISSVLNNSVVDVVDLESNLETPLKKEATIPKEGKKIKEIRKFVTGSHYFGNSGGKSDSSGKKKKDYLQYFQ